MAYNYQENHPANRIKAFATFGKDRAIALLRPPAPSPETNRNGPILRTENKTSTGFAYKEIEFVDKQGRHIVGALDLSNCTTSFMAGRGQGTERNVGLAGPHAVIPVGPVAMEGGYRFGPPGQTKFVNFASLGKDNNPRYFGSEHFVDRFEGFTTGYSQTFSGGIGIDNGKIVIGNQDELKDMDAEGLPVAQGFYSWHAYDHDVLGDQKWTVGKDYQKIRETVKNYTVVVQNEDGTKTFSYATKTQADTNSGAYEFDSIKTINDHLVGPEWKAVMVGWGLTGGWLVKHGKEPRTGSYPNPVMLHVHPFYLVARPKAA